MDSPINNANLSRNYGNHHNSSNNNSNKNTLSLKLQLNQIGRTEKTMSNRFRNITSKPKSDTFLRNIVRIINEIAPRAMIKNVDNFKKIKKIKSFLNDFIQKKGNFPELISRANQSIKFIDQLIADFKAKEQMYNALYKLNLSEEIKNSLKLGTVDIRYNIEENRNKRLKKKIMDLYKQFLDKYIENYKKLLDSNSNKISSIEQINLLDFIHPLFYKYYPNSMVQEEVQEDQEIIKKVKDIEKLKKLQYIKNYNNIIDRL